jgi:hypothetical protein
VEGPFLIQLFIPSCIVHHPLNLSTSTMQFKSLIATLVVIGSEWIIPPLGNGADVSLACLLASASPVPVPIEERVEAREVSNPQDCNWPTLSVRHL